MSPGVKVVVLVRSPAGAEVPPLRLADCWVPREGTGSALRFKGRGAGGAATKVVVSTAGITVCCMPHPVFLKMLRMPPTLP